MVREREFDAHEIRKVPGAAGSVPGKPRVDASIKEAIATAHANRMRAVDKRRSLKAKLPASFTRLAAMHLV